MKRFLSFLIFLLLILIPANQKNEIPGLPQPAEI